MTRTRKLAFATLTVLLFLLLVEGGARVVESWIDRGARGGTAGDVQVAFYGGSTVIGVPLPEVGFVEQFRVLFETRFPERKLTAHNFGASGIPSAGVVQRVSKTLPDDVDVLVVMTGHNEFIHGNMTVVDVELAYALGGALDRLASARLIRRAVTRVGRPQPETWRLESRSTPERDADRRVEAYGSNIAAILKIARSRGIPVLLCTTAANIDDWPPAKPGGAFRYPRELELDVQAVRAALDQGRWQQALTQLDDLLESRPDHPMLRYLRGQALRGLRRFADSRADLSFARDHDPLPRRVLSSMNDVVRAQAIAEGVTLIDVDRLFRKALAPGASSFQLFADNCHPTPQGGYLIATAILAEIERAGVAGAGAPGGPLLAATEVQERLNFGADSPLRLEYLARNARYCMKIPFFNYPVARGYLDQALRLAPERWDLWANHASMSLLSGEGERGVSELRQAMALATEPIDPADKRLTPYLEIALQAAGLRLEDRDLVGSGPVD